MTVDGSWMVACKRVDVYRWDRFRRNRLIGQVIGNLRIRGTKIAISLISVRENWVFATGNRSNYRSSGLYRQLQPTFSEKTIALKGNESSEAEFRLLRSFDAWKISERTMLVREKSPANKGSRNLVIWKRFYKQREFSAFPAVETRCFSKIH